MAVEETVRRIPLTRVVRSRWQPREQAFDAERLWELACSIREQGLINAIVVFPLGDGYELVAGERRTRAVMGLAWGKVDEISPKEAVARLAEEGLAAVPAEVRELLDSARAEVLARVEDDQDLDRLHRMAVVENIERESLSALEEARALEGLATANGWSGRQLAKAIGKSQSYVAQRLALLGLSDEAREAVSARVLTATHARAIARVPQALQPAVTAWVSQAVASDDSPATTRQVQNLARQVARFVDPARWEPNGDRVYEPEEWNWLAVMRWAVERADLEACGEAVLKLRGRDVCENLLGKKPIGIVHGPYSRNQVLHALGVVTAKGRTYWEEFAAATGRTCEGCVFRPYAESEEMASLVKLADFTGAHCRRWRSDCTTCDRFIGEDDPVVIPLSYDLRNAFNELEISYEGGEFEYMDDVAAYVVGVRRAAALKERQRAAVAEMRARVHIEDIAAFQEWQLEQPDAWLHHFQAHSCARCAHYRPELIEQELPACRFVVEPLKARNSWQADHRAPDFGVLVTREGWMLPRCEQFAYREVPVLCGVTIKTGVDFGKLQDRVGEWLVGLGQSGGVSGYGNNHRVWGILRWLDYGRPVDKSNDWDRLKQFLRREWENLGGDEVVATLLDVVLSERKARDGRQVPIHLVNGVTGKSEDFVPVDLGYVLGKVSFDGWRQREWPEGWPLPWEK